MLNVRGPLSFMAIPLMVSAVADAHFLRFQQVFITSLPTALYDFHTHTPSQSQFQTEHSDYIRLHTNAYSVLILISIFRTPLFHDMPAFDDIFRAPKHQKNLSCALRSVVCVFWFVKCTDGRQRIIEQKWKKRPTEMRAMRSTLFNCRLPARAEDVQTCTSTLETYILYLL